MPSNFEDIRTQGDGKVRNRETYVSAAITINFYSGEGISTSTDKYFNLGRGTSWVVIRPLDAGATIDSVNGVGVMQDPITIPPGGVFADSVNWSSLTVTMQGAGVLRVYVR